MHISAISHFASLDGRQICVAGAKEHCCVQQALLDGSHTAFLVNLQVVESQHGEDMPCPGSQSSPFSTMPLPHIWRAIVCRLGSGSTKHEVFVLPPDAPAINEPGPAHISRKKKYRVKPEPTYISEAAWREHLFSSLSNRAHNELSIGVACSSSR